MKRTIQHAIFILVMGVFSMQSFVQNIDEKEMLSLRNECGGVYFNSKEVLEKVGENRFVFLS